MGERESGRRQLGRGREGVEGGGIWRGCLLRWFVFAFDDVVLLFGFVSVIFFNKKKIRTKKKTKKTTKTKKKKLMKKATLLLVFAHIC